MSSLCSTLAIRFQLILLVSCKQNRITFAFVLNNDFTVNKQNFILNTIMTFDSIDKYPQLNTKTSGLTRVKLTFPQSIYRITYNFIGFQKRKFVQETKKFENAEEKRIREGKFFSLKLTDHEYFWPFFSQNVIFSVLE